MLSLTHTLSYIAGDYILQKIPFHGLMLTIKKMVQVLLKTPRAVKQAVMEEVDWEN